MLPDGSFCLAPPPPGIDATSYYNNMTSAVMAPPAPTEAVANLGSAPTPAETVTVATAATAPTQDSSSVPPASVPEIRWALTLHGNAFHFSLW